MIIQIGGAFLAVVTMAVISSAPRKFLWISGSIAAVSWLVYLICEDYGLGLAMSVFWATFVSAYLSHVLARRKKAPVTMFLIPGILPLVPGVNTYRIAYYAIARDSGNTTFYLNATITTAGMIAIGVFIVDTIFRLYSNVKKKRAQRKEV